MNFKDITNKVSHSEDLAAGRVRKISRAFLRELREVLNSGEDVSLPGMLIKCKTIPARDATDDKPARPERRSIVLRLKKVKDSQSESVEIAS